MYRSLNDRADMNEMDGGYRGTTLNEMNFETLEDYGHHANFEMRDLLDIG